MSLYKVQYSNKKTVYQLDCFLSISSNATIALLKSNVTIFWYSRFANGCVINRLQPWKRFLYNVIPYDTISDLLMRLLKPHFGNGTSRISKMYSHNKSTLLALPTINILLLFEYIIILSTIFYPLSFYQAGIYPA